MKKVQFPGRLSVCTADDGCRAHWRNDFKLDLIIIFDGPAILSWCIGPSQNPGSRLLCAVQFSQLLLVLGLSLF